MTVAPRPSRVAAQVAAFHTAYDLPLRTRPTVEVGADQLALRQALIEEEVAELAGAARAGDLIGIADALGDIVYVAYGTAHVYGIDLDGVVDAIHVSNMTKLGADGRPIRRADGKILKGPDYRPPEIGAVLHRLVEEIARPDHTGAVDKDPQALPGRA
ncbi:MAG: nucleotide pyrophosphohydrolase [Nakamurella sp.]